MITRQRLFHEFHALPATDGAVALNEKWSRLRELRSLALKRIEEQRTAGAIGSSLQGELAILANGSDFDLLTALGDDLRFVMITSSAVAKCVATASPVSVIVTASAHSKCERCWHFRADVGSNTEHPTICGRCVTNLFGEGEKRFYA